MYKRQARIVHPTSLSSQPLNIILEEEESRASSSRSTSPMSQYTPCSSPTPSPSAGVKAKRRRANVSDIRIAKDFVGSDSDLSPLDDTLLIPSRPAPSPPISIPEPSPESVQLTFTDVSYRFPLPPVPTPSSIHFYERSECHSPALSASSISSSPRSHHAAMPLTPSTSDDEFSLPTRTFNPRRAAIQPLVIQKHNPRPMSPSDEIVKSSLLHPMQQAQKTSSRPTSPLSDSSFLTYDSSESDSESDSEFYNKEFSKILTLRSPLPPSFPQQQPSRPESMAISGDFLPSPPAPKRTSRRISIPKYPPPPVPPIPAHLRSEIRKSVSPSPSPSCPKILVQAPRPPPRSSIPADFTYDVDIEDDSASSAFSFSMYEIDFGDNDCEDTRSVSAYSQPSQVEDDFPVDDIRFDIDMPLMLPLSLPNTPLDLEHDIAMGLEQLRNTSVQPEAPAQEPLAVVPEETSSGEEPQPEVVIQQEATVYEQEFIQDIFTSPVSSPTPSSFSFGSYYSPCASPAPHGQSPYQNNSPVLKSKWSTSTLGSIREEHERRSASAKLRLYFNAHSPIKSKRGSSSSTSTPSKSKHSSQQVPSTPSSPFYSMMSPRKSSRSSPSPRGNSAYGHVRHDSDVLGYGQAGVRRRPSVNSVSDAGSEESSSSTSSSGLRRKPIPVEMFIRSAIGQQ
ncbi:hypothetical protein CVT24_001432 [Panaeolus cyanescens]|uniref:Uncharacterized protein n=1 Tax=Panaeolus cyanescens TaxID=181874 RepID=A0A409W3F4_9AGAR|nr:hypothetical protein CVT24_001432 [Panaeolus cyanescens]